MKNMAKAINNVLAKDKLHQARPGSIEWYLSNNLRNLLSAVECSPANGGDVAQAAYALSRFAVDSMSWNDPLFTDVTDIVDMAKLM